MLGDCVTVRWWDRLELMGCQGVSASSEAVILTHSILGDTALVQSGNNRALDEKHLIIRSLKNLETNPLFEKPFGSEIFKFWLENALALKKKKKPLRNKGQDMIKYCNYGIINTCSRSFSEGRDQ